MCVTESASYMVSVRNYVLWLSDNFNIFISIPSTSVSRDLLYIIPETYSTPTYYTNKNCRHAIIFYVTLHLRPIKKQRNPLDIENKTAATN